MSRIRKAACCRFLGDSGLLSYVWTSQQDSLGSPNDFKGPAQGSFLGWVAHELISTVIQHTSDYRNFAGLRPWSSWGSAQLLHLSVLEIKTTPDLPECSCLF